VLASHVAYQICHSAFGDGVILPALGEPILLVR
jgi:hypothetical protein